MARAKKLLKRASGVTAIGRKISEATYKRCLDRGFTERDARLWPKIDTRAFSRPIQRFFTSPTS